jgi:hypothetical protein
MDNFGARHLFKWMLVFAAGPALGSAAAISSGKVPGADGHITYIARDYGFAGPESVAGGTTEITLINQGEDVHHLQFIQLPDGKTAAHFKAAIDADSRRMPSWAIRMGGPNAIIPGAQAVAILNLPPGRYVVICGIPDGRGIPHVALGMLKAVDIAPPGLQSFKAPPSDLSITAADFSYALSQSVTAGNKIIQMINKGAQPHEVVVVKLAAGAGIKDYAEAFQPGVALSPAGEPIGGMVGLQPGGEGHFRINFARGRYGLICFLPDIIRGAPHFTRGMMTDFTIE